MSHCRRIVVNPPPFGLVGHRERITGRAPRGTTRVQILVLSADGQWYLQQEAAVSRRGHWTAECAFGFPESVHDFKVVAVADGDPITNDKLQDVPTTMTASAPVDVSRVF